MPDIKKTIIGLQSAFAFIANRDDEHWNNIGCNAINDAIAMLKEQETTNICHKRNARIFSCEKCGYGLDDIYLTNERDYPIEPAYCPNCGRKVVDDA